MNDLIERLEGVDDDTPGDYLVDLCYQASDEIERLQARVEVLEGDLATAQRSLFAARVVLNERDAATEQGKSDE